MTVMLNNIHRLRCSRSFHTDMRKMKGSGWQKNPIPQFGLIIPCRKIWRIKLLTHMHSRLGEMSFNLARAKADDAGSYLIHAVSTVPWDPCERTRWEEGNCSVHLLWGGSKANDLQENPKTQDHKENTNPMHVSYTYLYIYFMYKVTFWTPWIQ